MKRQRMLLSLVILWYGSSCSAAIIDWVSITKCFNEFLNNESGRGCYLDGSCEINVYNLANRCLKQNAKDAKVLFLLDSNGDLKNPKLSRTIPTYNSRGGEKSWNYHVFLELDGKVIDPDFGSSPRITSREAYLKKMFKIDKNNKYILKVTSVENYLNNFWEVSLEDIVYRKSLFTEIIFLNDYRKKCPNLLMETLKNL